MSRIANIKWNDTSNGPGIGVSIFVQGCPHHCVGCWNPETWNFEGGSEIPNDIRGQIIKGLSVNNIERCLNVLGGEPLCPENKYFINDIISAVRAAYPQIKIYVWTGYTYNELLKENDESIKDILSKIDYLIDGRYIEDKRDITLKLRGSTNQNIVDLSKNL